MFENLDRTTTKASSLRASVKDAQSYAVMVGAGETYFGSFGVFLHATAMQIGVLATLPQAVGAICQLLSSWLTEKYRTRRTIMVASACVHALSLLPMVFIALMAPNELSVPWVIVSAVLYFIAAGFVAPPWNSLIGDIVPRQIRGSYFALRNRKVAIWTFLSLMAAGKIISYFQNDHGTNLGFAVIFLIAACARLISAYFLLQHEDVPYQPTTQGYLNFPSFIRTATKSNFGLFVFYLSIMNFFVHIAGPYFTLYMLRDIQLSMIEYTIVIGTAVVAQFFTLTRWGRIADTFGSKFILNVCGYGIAIGPALWLISSNFYWLLTLQILAGFFWAGFNLAAQNYLFDAVNAEHRARAAAHLGVVNGLLICLGSLVGALIVNTVPFDATLLTWSSSVKSPLLLLFLLSTLGRFATSVFFLRRFKEVRDNVREPDTIVFRVSHLRPIAGAVFSVVTSGSQKKRNKGL